MTFTRQTGYTGDIYIPSGTRVQIPNTTKFFTVVKNTTLAAADSSVEVFVSAASSGTDGNVGVSVITQLVDTITGIISVSNTLPITGGTDEETDADRKIRFQKWVNSLARATRSALAYGATTSALYDENGVVIEQVKKVKIWEPCIDEDPPGEPGYVKVYIWNGSTGASADLIAQTKKILVGYTLNDGTKVPGWKGAGIIIDVYTIEAYEVNITADLTLLSGYTIPGVTQAVTNVIDAYFAELEIGESLIWSKLVELIRGVDGIYDISISDPSGNVNPGQFSVCTRGTITLS